MIHHTTGHHHLGEEGAVHLAREVLAQDGGEAVHDRLRLERHEEGTEGQKSYVRRYQVSISAFVWRGTWRGRMHKNRMYADIQ